MAINWTYKKSCCEFSLYEKIGMICICISVMECWLLCALNIYVGMAALIGYMGFVILMTHLEEKNIIEGVRSCAICQKKNT